MSRARFVTHESTVRSPTGKGSQEHYFGEHRSDAHGPQGFMVNYGPGFGADAHFHHANQFQIFFGTPGCYYQRHEVGPALLHYAEADTLYGPFGAGEGPLHFLTLRQHGTNFTGVMPDDREFLNRGGHHAHFQKDLSDWLGRSLPERGTHTVDLVVPNQRDGVCAFGILAGSGAEIIGPASTESGGQYYVVVEGMIRYEDDDFPELSVGWCPADAGPPVFVAGPAGTRVLILQFGPEAENSMGQSSDRECVEAELASDAG